MVSHPSGMAGGRQAGLTMKGLLLAGGTGQRLYPATKILSKQLLPVYDKPTIYYPLSTLMLAGLREILIIGTPRDLPMIRELLGDGSQIGLDLHYAEQSQARGIAEAFLIGEDFLADEGCALILGDNVFYGQDVTSKTRAAVAAIESSKGSAGAVIFAHHVHDPERYGVVELDASGRALSLEEKPSRPKSPWAVTGLGFYDNRVASFAKSLSPSVRGELELTDINRLYLQHAKLEVQCFGRGVTWLDTGTPESLTQSSQFVQTIEARQGLKIGCIEEIALRMGYISPSEFARLIETYPASSYTHYLRALLS